jgi:putative component of membrane protein insertase Oxa1/YidC/SpoIIIJ protein YidD
MEYMYKSAQTFQVLTSLHWPSCSEMEVCKLEQHLCVKTAICHGRNALKCHTELLEALRDHSQIHQAVTRRVQAF